MDTRRCGPPLVVGLGGDPKVGAATDMALITALRGAEDAGARTEFFDGASVERFLPSDLRPSSVRQRAHQFMEAVRAADALIVAGPWEGSGVLPAFGTLFNGNAEPLLGLPVGAMATDANPTVAEQALPPFTDALRRMGAWVAPASFAIAVRGAPFGPTGLCVDEALGDRLATLGRQVLEFALARRMLERRDGDEPSLAPRRGWRL